MKSGSGGKGEDTCRLWGELGVEVTKAEGTGSPGRHVNSLLCISNAHPRDHSGNFRIRCDSLFPLLPDSICYFFLQIVLSAYYVLDTVLHPSLLLQTHRSHELAEGETFFNECLQCEPGPLCWVADNILSVHPHHSHKGSIR